VAIAKLLAVVLPGTKLKPGRGLDRRGSLVLAFKEKPQHPFLQFFEIP
jgi:hypothetical protein